MKDKINNRNCEIDFYRFIFSVVILLFHSRSLFPDSVSIIYIMLIFWEKVDL